MRHLLQVTQVVADLRASALRAAGLTHGQRRGQHDEAVKAAFRSCQTAVQQYDAENFMWVKGLPADVRPPVMMLRALNVETSMIGEMVSQGGAPLREMRFQWWKDSIDQAYKDQSAKHPVLTALRYTLGITSLSKYRLQRMVAAKATDQVTHQPPTSLKSLEDFTEATQSNLLYLHLEAAGIKSADADHAASHLGKGIGIGSLLRGTHHFLQRGISYFPVDLCAQHGVAAEELYRGQSLGSEATREVVFEMAAAANSHLQASEELHGRPEAVPTEARRMFQSSVACTLFLQALEKSNFDLTDKRLAHGGFSPLWHLVKLRMARM
jgi:NADH dehydrogenase [ubiquinone] 1 alpha subcomplex assembly factor 6